MEGLTKILAVAGGGAFGAVLRYLISLSPIQNLFGKFPFHTFFINISGSFLMGFLFILFSDKWTANEHLKVAVMIGFLGAFTTFSTFELEIWQLVEEQQCISALGYLSASLLLGFAGVIAGVRLGKFVVNG